MVDAFLFDIGNVLLRFDFGAAIRKVAGHCAIEPHEIFSRVIPLKDDYECGRIGRMEFLTRATVMLGYNGTQEEFITAWQDIFIENEPVTLLIEALAPRYPLFLMSNTSDLHMEFIRAKFAVLTHFRGGIYSHETGTLKPDRKIYEAAITQLDLTPERTVFIDDLAPNVEAARLLGFHAIQYDHTRHEELLVVLRDQHGVRF